MARGLRKENQRLQNGNKVLWELNDRLIKTNQKLKYKNEMLLTIYKNLKQTANKAFDQYVAIERAVKKELRHRPDLERKIFFTSQKNLQEFKSDGFDWKEIHDMVKELENAQQTFS